MMVPLLLKLSPLSLGFAQTEPQDRFSRIPLWTWILVLFLIVAIVGIIITLREEEEVAGQGAKTQPPPPPAPEPAKPAVAASAEVDTEVQPPAEQPSPRPDNLKRVSGIGPKIEKLLNENGITTFVQLAATEVSRLQALIVEAGWEKLADPTTWPEQARNLAEEQ